VPTFDGNYYFAADGYVTEGANANAKFVDSKGTIKDPQYKNAAAGDFTVGDEDIKYYGVGDPRWTK
jgi:hypothetical protein